MSNWDISSPPNEATDAHSPATAAAPLPMSPPEPTSRDLPPNGNGHGAAPHADGPTPRLQIIDENKDFSADLEAYMERTWDMAGRGFDYNLVAVFGSQSTGKSTLLNRLFQTDFAVMNEASRGQTTKGIWLARAPALPTLVMDVEGTDGRERGEDQDFERKSSLFALAIAEVIILNMWEHMVGLYHGANMGLLKTVMEVNLQLFQKKNAPKTHLFFVIRDHASGTPLANLADTVSADLNKIWASLAKPAGLEDSTLQQFFDVTFTSLPHKRLMPKDFEAEASALRRRFVDPYHLDYVFRPHYKKGIPADGFPHFARDIWAQINSNRDLDLPSQQELLAQFRCDELAATALDGFTTAVVAAKTQVDAGNVVETLGATLNAALDAALAPFDTQASRYHKAVYQRKRRDLVDRAHAAAFIAYSGQLRNAHRRAVVLFKSSLDFRLKAKSADFYNVVEAAQTEVLAYFSNIATSSRMTEAEWSFDEPAAALRDELDHLIQQRRDDELAKLVHAVERKVQSDLPDAVAELLATPTADMWPRVDAVFRDELSSAEEDLTTRATALRITDAERDARIAALRTASITSLRDALATATTEAALVQKLKHTFEASFRYDEHGVPRVWKPSDDIDGAYRRAREVAQNTLQAFVVADLPSVTALEASLGINGKAGESGEGTRSLFASGGVDEAVADELHRSIVALRKPLLPASKTATLQSRFRLEADAMYTDAKRSVVATQAHIPRWLLGVMVVLGWNEFVELLRSPMLLLFLIFLGAVGFVVYATGMSGPLMVVGSRVGAEVARQVGEKVHEATGGRGIVGSVNEYVMHSMNTTTATAAGGAEKPPLPPRPDANGKPKSE
ncbi:Dynamin-like GTPase that mediates homotypic ER fusion [Blastocladiella emersonii ATCC 22665]|nr:Dynamin-like GTPase that mediates homotypic ER fusion [Blastocladiella emersonii ATCC 22665]